MIKTTSQDLEIHVFINAEAFWHPVLAPCHMFNICVLTVNRLLRMAKTAHEKHIYEFQAAT